MRTTLGTGAFGRALWLSALLFGDVEFVPGRNGKAIKFPE